VLNVVGSRLRRGASPDAISAFDDLVAAVDAESLSAAVAAHLREDNRTTAWLSHDVVPSEPTTPTDESEADDAK
jgi:hypothetical protein